MLELAAAKQLAIQAAEMAGQIALENFDQPKDIRFKGRSNPVTNVDLEAEAAIVNLIEARFPQHNVLSEEVRVADRGSDLTWIIDPIDGTMNYSSGIPIFCVSIAVARDDQPILGVVHDPVRRDTFVALEGGGAFLNGKRIQVSQKNALAQANVGLDLGYQEVARLRAMETMLAMRVNVQSFRLIGSAVLGACYAASGRFDLYFHPSVYAWDLAASTIIAREAGGIVTDFSGQHASTNSRSFIVSNPGLHAQFRALAAPHMAP